MEKSITIGELARLSGTNAITIQYYEKCGILCTNGDHRLYDDVLVARLQFIHHAKLAGFSLDDICELITLQSQKHLLSQQVKAFVAKKIQTIDTKIAVVQGIKISMPTLAASHDGKSKIEHCSILQALRHEKIKPAKYKSA